jgi:hypothetical protein
MRFFVAPGSPAPTAVVGCNPVEWRPMNCARTHQSLIAWMLYGFILFSALVCSISHGQMLGAFNQSGDSDICGAQQAASGQMDMAGMEQHALIMKLSMTDCAFAGTLALSLVFFIGLSWLAGALRDVIPRLDAIRKKPPRHSLPGRSPQAP